MVFIRIFKSAWSFRDMIKSSVQREFKSRWAGTQLGPIWLLIQPLATILIFTVIFSHIMKPGMPAHASGFAYSIYLCSGILAYNLFSELLTRNVSVFVENANLIKKINFPKICLSIIVLLSGLMNFTIISSFFLLFLILTSAFPGWVILSTLPVLLIQLLFTMGLGMFLATLNVFYRDIEQTVQVILQFWFWLTPIVYIDTSLPDTVQHILSWNPLFPIIKAYQGIFLDHQVPDCTQLIYPLFLAFFFNFLGVFTFHRLQSEIMDEL